MTPDALIAHLAALPRSKRPTELRSDSQMLRAWLACRSLPEFYRDVILRHGLDMISASDFSASCRTHEHAIGNALGWLLESVVCKAS